MPFPFPTFCPFEDGQEHLSQAHVACPEAGQRCYTLPIGVLDGHSDDEVLQLEAAINEADAHLSTLRTQLWLRTVLGQWKTTFPTVGALRVNLVTDINGLEEWRFEFWVNGDVYECNSRGYTKRPPWEDPDNPPPADRYRREPRNVENAAKALRDLLVDLPKNDLTALLVDEAFKLLPTDTGMTKQAWGDIVFATMPASVVPESRAVALDERLPGEAARKPVAVTRF